jgi:hypothetical protein
MLEAPDLRVPTEFRDYLRLLKERVARAHLDYLKSVGVQEEHLQGWEKLIDLRYHEYAQDRHEVRAAAMQVESKDKPLEMGDLTRIQMLVPVQTVAIGCHEHICRGETKGRDALFKLVLKWLSKFYVDIRLRLEGGKVTPIMKAKVVWKQMIRRRRKKK